MGKQAGVDTGRRSFGWFSGLSIQSKLLLMLLAVSLPAMLLVGLLGYRSAADSLRDRAFEQLKAQRAATQQRVGRFFRNMRNHVFLLSQDQAMEEAAAEFTAAFAKLKNAKLDKAKADGLDRFYSDTYLPAVKANLGGAPELASYLPQQPAERYLQANYTASGVPPDKLLDVDDAGDGSDWSKVNKARQPYTRALVTRNGFEDLYLIDAKTLDVVYSADKGPDLGSNLERGPYARSYLAESVKSVLRSGDRGSSQLTDFDQYLGTFGRAKSFVASPIAKDGEIVAVLALQLPKEQINEITTRGGQWAEEGFGRTGESYLVGPDNTMRSVSRSLIQNKRAFLENATATGVPPDTVASMRRLDATLLLQPANSAAVMQAGRGRTGALVGTNYRGAKSIMAYSPAGIEGLDWVVIATVDEDEALAPVNDLTRQLVLSVLAVIIGVSLLGLLLAHLFNRPIDRLVTAVRRVAAGERDVVVPVTSSDSFGELSAAFNDMSHSLQAKAELLDEQQAANERLLRQVMPEQMARRFGKGEEITAEEHDAVTVLYADIDGIATSGASGSALNELINGLDEAAGRHGVVPGVEKIHPQGVGYLASCGLEDRHVGQMQRMIAFALEMGDIVERHGRLNRTQPRVRVGIDTGPVTAGLVGRSKLVFEMWGETVNLAHRVIPEGGSGVFVTQRAHDEVSGLHSFTQVGSVGREPVWRLEPEGARQ